MRSILAAALMTIALAACSTTPTSVGDMAPHTLTAGELTNHTLTFTAKDKFEVKPAEGGIMTFRDIGAPAKTGSGQWEIREGKFWLQSSIYWRRGSYWTFYGPAADGSFIGINNRDSRKTHYRIDIK